ncbi:MAG: molybdenum cofactor biosynthesis protein [Bryobacteraceae bacterium]
MRVRVLFFGMLKDVVGDASGDLEFPEGASLDTVFESFAARFPHLRQMARSIVVARNREFADPATRIEEGDEVAFLPPVSGGASTECWETAEGGHWFGLTRHTIDTGALGARLLTGAEGAVVTFEGVVRNNTNGRATVCLDYEGYESMALETMSRIGQEIARSFPITRIAMVHRLGRLLIGETSVAVMVTAPHRQAAFEAALEGINRLKRLVPIWKKEHFADGAVWVEGEWDRNVPAVG